MDASIIQTGRFTSNGQAKTLQVRSGFDWIQTYNLTKITTPANVTLQAYWQLGMPSGQGVKYNGSAGANTLQLTALAAGTGFTPVDSAGNPLGVSYDTTSVSNATNPVVLTADTTGLADGFVVRLTNNVNTRQVNGYDFSVDAVTPNTSFRIAAALANNTDGAALQDGKYRIVKFDPLYYPRSRYLANVTRAAQAVVTVTVPSGYAVGQTVKFIVPAAFGMVELDQQVGTITAVNDTLATQTITVDIDTTTFTLFKFPSTADYPFSPAMVVPVGENTAYAIQQSQNILSDATYNTGYIGVILAGGANSPAGQTGDAIYWVAGKSSYTQNP